ncbi:MAG: IPT/TIG domain-containing protein [Acidimicrobiales bacterium]
MSRRVSVTGFLVAAVTGLGATFLSGTALGVTAAPFLAGSAAFASVPDAASQVAADGLFGSGAPSVSGIDPQSGLNTGGTSVTITGMNLGGATGVYFGSVGATKFTVSSDTSITAVSPPHPAGTVDVTVSTPFGVSNTSSADRFSYLVLDISPSPGPTPGPSRSEGYSLLASDGGVFTYGSAKYYGSAGAMKLNSPIVGMAADSATGGYWLVASDGGVFSFNAAFYGSAGAMKLNSPIVGMASTASGDGYWLVASDGGVFTYGSAKYYGSAGAMKLNSPIVGMAADSATGGYWLVGSDGGVFSYDAPYLGSTGAMKLNAPMVGMAFTPGG